MKKRKHIGRIVYILSYLTLIHFYKSPQIWDFVQKWYFETNFLSSQNKLAI